jgi:hypothetical protein
MRRRTQNGAINKVEDTLTKKIWLHLHSSIEIIIIRKLQQNNLLSIGQSNYDWSWGPHNMKRNDRNMRTRTIVLFCKVGGLLLWEGATSSNLCVVGRWCYNTGLVEGEVESSRVH